MGKCDDDGIDVEHPSDPQAEDVEVIYMARARLDLAE
jgi:hypothetical protein